MAEKHSTRLHNILAWRLRTERQRLAQSQAAFAERLGISTGYLAALELGKKFPSAACLQQIASALGLEAYRLLVPPDEKPSAVERELAYSISTKLRHLVDQDIKDYLERNYGTEAPD